MSIFDTLDHMGAELVAGRAVVRHEGKKVVVARMVNGSMQPTADGRELIQAAEAAVETTKAKPKRRKPKADPAPGPDPDAAIGDLFEGLSNGNG